MSRRKPTFQRIVDTDPELVRLSLRGIHRLVRQRCAELGIARSDLDALLEPVSTFGDYQALVQCLSLDPEWQNASDILAYPVPILSDPVLAAENGKPNWKLVNKLNKGMDYPVRLPLRSEGSIGFDTVRALVCIIMSPEHGRRHDLEKEAWLADTVLSKPHVHSYSRALLLLHHLSYRAAIAAHPQFAVAEDK